MDYSTIFTEPEANNRFSIIAEMLSNSVLDSPKKIQNCKSFYHCLDYSYQDKRPVSTGILQVHSFHLQKKSYLSVENCYAKLVSIFFAFQNDIFFQKNVRQPF